jgi:excisionase family DNA binding protein
MKPLNLQVSIVFDEESLGPILELLRRLLAPQVIAEEQNQRQRASQHALLGGQKKLPEDKGLLLDTKQVSKLLRVSPRTVFAMQKSGKLPAPIRIGRLVRWSSERLQEWALTGGSKLTARATSD